MVVVIVVPQNAHYFFVATCRTATTHASAAAYSRPGCVPGWARTPAAHESIRSHRTRGLGVPSSVAAAPTRE
ncbi:hypothetical protein SS50377_20745 [Spironucleus salmonicida]|uniref:Uncharacterized protein n=1 Tax=Spironucleus salmonicida TaxID=348837 RepID=A0A9P8M0L0_9EUKA|nr:hypothetical protein SS50377_20745 [Spironucleus salmonicida]